MPETLNTLKTRRSCRAYRPDPVEEEKLQQILEAGTYAATGMGWQSPIILAVTDREMRDRLSRMNAAVMGRDMDPFYGAPVVLVVLADRSIVTHVYDGSLVMGNLMNAAHAIGLGSCWIDRAEPVFETEEGKALKAKWGVSEEYVGVGHCILGHTDETPEPKPRKDGYVIYAE